MGSFDFTCCISGLPIGWHDPVRYILLTEQLPGEERHHLDSRWILRTFPLRGLYNDYGLAEVLQRGPAQEIWLDALQLDLIETGPGDNTFHQVPVRKGMSFEEIQTALWKECVFVRDRLSAETFQDTQLLKLSSLTVDRLTLLRNTNPEELLHPGKVSADHAQQAFLRTFDKSATARVLQDKLVYGLGKHFDLMLEKEPSEAELNEFLDSVGETLYVQVLLRILRYQWHPAGPTGPQCGEWDLHKDFLQRLRAIADCVIRQRAED